MLTRLKNIYVWPKPCHIKILIILAYCSFFFLRNALKRPETMSKHTICVLILLITLLNVQLSFLRLPASWADVFIEWPYLRAWHYNDMVWNCLIFCCCLQFDLQYALLWKKQYICEKIVWTFTKEYQALYQVMICSAGFGSW